MAMTHDLSPEVLLLLEEKDRIIAEQASLISQLLLRIEDLERQLGLNSRNSSKPPSSDGLKKRVPSSLREKSGQASGGQFGHKGDTLKQVAQADESLVHRLTSCPHCTADLTESTVVDVRVRQVFDIPEPRVSVTEHQAQIKHCPHCKRTVIADFPEDVSAPVQYGSRVKALSVYLHQQQMIPEDRLAILFEDVFGLSISAATLVNHSRAFAEKVMPLTAIIRERLRTAAVKNLDESGLRVAAKLHWLHVMSNEHWTYYHVAEKRGEIPRDLTGTIVHDHFKPYYTLEDVTHALCGGHHLRELKGLEEIEKEPWARSLSRLFKLACHLAHQGMVPAVTRARIECLYDSIVERGLAFHENQTPLQRGARGRAKRRPGHNLAIRLRDHKQDALRFLADPNVPFTNNQAEQDIRMIKVKQKISGSFRALSGAQVFATTRSFLSTMRKQGLNLFNAISEPFLSARACSVYP